MRGVRICTRPWSIASHPSRALEQRKHAESRKMLRLKIKASELTGLAYRELLGGLRSAAKTAVWDHSVPCGGALKTLTFTML